MSIKVLRVLAIFIITYCLNILPVHNPTFTSILGNIGVNADFEKLAEEVRFELTEPLRAQHLSTVPLSAAQPLFHKLFKKLC